LAPQGLEHAQSILDLLKDDDPEKASQEDREEARQENSQGCQGTCKESCG
jgi:hypothetical protein